jgi:predicted negative regulator of RcsB-dependent stress response
MEINATKPNKIESLKNFWDRKKGTIAVTAIATTAGMVALMRAQQKTVNGFLEGNDLMEKFMEYLGADEEELAPFK